MLQTYLPNYDFERRRLSKLGPAGWTLAFNFTLGGCEVMDSTMPEVWQKLYLKQTVFLDDPVFRWVAKREAGIVRWSEIHFSDPLGILKAAAVHGMRFGCATTIVVNDFHSFLTLARSDREFLDDELHEIEEKFVFWVNLLHNRGSLTDAEIATLGAFKDGLTQQEAAERLNVSEATIKYRSQKAQKKLKAKTSNQAVGIAIERGFFKVDR